MSDDMNNKIQQIAELLSQENMPDNVKGLLSLLAGSLGGKEDTQPKTSNEDREKEDRPMQNSTDDSDEMIRKVKKVVDKLNTGNDPRINLLHAIKPFMNSNRQKKISNCIQLLQMTSLTRLMGDKEK
jgi:hypothetical protein